jgi:two-component system nitrate/nitrite response regulator NarL
MAQRKAGLLRDAVLPLALISPSPLVLAGLRSGLTQFGGFDIVLAGAGLDDAREAAFARAEVAIVDLDSDAEALGDDDQGPAADGPPLVLLVPRQRAAAELLRAGCSVLPADAPIAMIAAAAHAAAAGLVVCTPGLASDALRFAGIDRQPDALADPLTPREREVLAQMAFGLGNREIADALHISTHTAKFHVAQIISKLDANSRGHAIAKAMRAGLVAA